MKKKKGQALVEFAIVLPILLLFFCGIIDFGRILHAGASLNMAAQESVRLAGLGRSDNEVIQFAKDKSYPGAVVSFSTPASPRRTAGSYVTLYIYYDVKYITPLMNKFLGSTYRVQAKSTIRVE
jgi:uncharacterized protein (UPF0333 family)